VSPGLEEAEPEAGELDDEELDEELAYFAQLGDSELDDMIALYDKLLALVDRLGSDAELSDADMEILAAAADAGVIALTFEDDEVTLQVADEGDLILESSLVEE